MVGNGHTPAGEWALAGKNNNEMMVEVNHKGELVATFVEAGVRGILQELLKQRLLLVQVQGTYCRFRCLYISRRRKSSCILRRCFFFSSI